MPEYLNLNESTNSQYKEQLWNTAKGLQSVDGLTTSKYLDVVSKDNINNILSYNEVLEKLYSYYGQQDNVDTLQKEADIVATRIVQFLNTHSFSPGIPGLLGIHDFLFNDILSELNVGRLRRNNIYKAEDILNGDTVNYGDSASNRFALEYLFSNEKRYEYNYPMNKYDIEHLSMFVSELWQIHPFSEGNTRTTAVYTIMYLRSKGIDIDNDLFKSNSDYFRKALVRSCYENLKIGVRPDLRYIEMFFENLLKGSDNDLNIKQLQLPYNEQYAKEIASKLSSIAGNGIDEQGLMKLFNDKNVEVRKAAQYELSHRINREELKIETDDDIDL